MRKPHRMAWNDYLGFVFPFQTTEWAAALNFPLEHTSERAGSPFSNSLTDLCFQANDYAEKSHHFPQLNAASFWMEIFWE